MPTTDRPGRAEIRGRKETPLSLRLPNHPPAARDLKCVLREGFSYLFPLARSETLTELFEPEMTRPKGQENFQVFDRKVEATGFIVSGLACRFPLHDESKEQSIMLLSNAYSRVVSTCCGSLVLYVVTVLS